MLAKILTWLETHMGTCSFHEASGMVCPGCGLQRSIIALLKGDVLQSFLLFPALLPLTFMFAYLGLHLVFRFKYGAIVLKVLYIANTAIIIGNYLFKLTIQ